MRNRLTAYCSGLLIFLWIYVAGSKLLDFNRFSRQLHAQPFPDEWTPVLAVLLPASELIIALLLCIPGFRKIGLYLSAALLTAFTVYIGLILAGLFERVPCSCGGMLNQLTWKAHFLVNLGLLAIAMLGIISARQDRRIQEGS